MRFLDRLGWNLWDSRDIYIKSMALAGEDFDNLDET
jgi:hypothetical protein